MHLYMALAIVLMAKSTYVRVNEENSLMHLYMTLLVIVLIAKSKSTVHTQ